MNYYVSTSGSDTNSGAIDKPFLTLAKAESVVLPGDIVTITTGTYAGATLTKSGISGAMIELRAQGSVTLNSTLNIPSAYRLVRGITVTQTANTPNYGIKVGADGNTGGENASNNVLDNVRIIGNATGTFHGILFGGGGSNNTLKNSYFFGSYYGLVDKCAKNSLAYNNTFNFSSSGLYVCIYGKGAQGSWYFNNTMVQTGGANGIILASSDGGTPIPTGVLINNNIFVCGAGFSPAIFAGDGAKFSSDYNCFQYPANSTPFYSNPPAKSYNSLAAWQATGQDLHSIAATPLFKNGSGTEISDYTPLAGSPVIDKGQLIISRTTDALNNPIIAAPDIGALEYQTTTTMSKYFIATNGNDSNAGTIASPFKTIEKIQSLNLVAGDIVEIRAGTYPSTSAAANQFGLRITSKNGTSTNPIIIRAYPDDFVNGGRVVYDCSNIAHFTNCFGIWLQTCTWIDCVGIYVKGVPQQPITVSGAATGTVTGSWWSNGCSNNRFINCEASNAMSGFRLDDGSNTTYINCDAHDCDDPYTGAPTGAHNNSDGFSRTAAGNAATNTKYIGCRSWHNSDDGWDCIDTPGTIYYENCWSFWNGFNAAGQSMGDGNAFKMGGTKTLAGLTRFVNRCLAVGNKWNGFDQNAGFFTAQFYNNTSYKNGSNDYKYGYNPPIAHQFRNNLSYKNPITDGLTTDANAWNPNDHNSWNSGMPAVTDNDFISLDDTQLIAKRKPNGDLPDITFLHLKPGSAFVNAGIDVGLPYTGTAPDLGAFETGTVTPTTYSNVAVSKSFQKNNCTTGTGSSVIYAVPAGKYTSTVSQAAADQLATDDINNNGQNWANINGTCTGRTITKVVIYYSDGTTNTQT